MKWPRLRWVCRPGLPTILDAPFGARPLRSYTTSRGTTRHDPALNVWRRASPRCVNTDKSRDITATVTTQRARMHIAPLFPTPLIQADLPGAGDVCRALRAAILTREQHDPGVQHSNLGGWQSAADFFEWGGDAATLLRASMIEVANRYTAILESTSFSQHPIEWRINAWANVNRAGQINDLHAHPGAFWSAVFYVDDGGADGGDTCGGAIEFTDPRGYGPLMHAPMLKFAIEHCASAGLSELRFPKTGRLFMFPAWLAHRTTAFHGAAPRISIAANFAAQLG